MPSSDSEEFRIIEAEFRRIGLDPYELPGLAISVPISEFIEYLRSMPAGATWRELFPDLPEHWIPGRPDTWSDAGEPGGPDDLEAEIDSNHDPRDDTESRPQVGFRLKAGAFDTREFFAALAQRVDYHDVMTFEAINGEVPGTVRFAWETTAVVVDGMAAWLRSLPFVAKVSPSYGGVIPQTDDGA